MHSLTVRLSGPDVILDVFHTKPWLCQWGSRNPDRGELSKVTKLILGNRARTNRSPFSHSKCSFCHTLFLWQPVETRLFHILLQNGTTFPPCPLDKLFDMDEEVSEVFLGLISGCTLKRKKMKCRLERKVWGGRAFQVLLWIKIVEDSQASTKPSFPRWWCPRWQSTL